MSGSIVDLIPNPCRFIVMQLEYNNYTTEKWAVFTCLYAYSQHPWAFNDE
jgi:hypothetical protein